MITYTEHYIDGKLFRLSSPEFPSIGIDTGNSQYSEMLELISSGDAEKVIQDDTPIPTVDELRIASYGSFGEQADMQYWDAVNSTTTWVDHIAAVKLANPK